MYNVDMTYLYNSYLYKLKFVKVCIIATCTNKKKIKNCNVYFIYINVSIHFNEFKSSCVKYLLILSACVSYTKN